MTGVLPQVYWVIAPVVRRIKRDYDFELMIGAVTMPIVPVFHPVSPLAKTIVDFSVVILVICGIILLIVTSLITYSLLKFRAKPGDPEPPQTTGHKGVEIVWTAIPLLLVTFLFILTARAMNLSHPPTNNHKPDMVVIGHQWWWEARYPDSGAMAVNEIHIPTGKPLLLLLDSADVIHDFWVPQLARKMDMVPGHPNEMWLQADQPGTYYGTCAEYCGGQHAWMRLMVVAQPPNEFAAWEKEQLKPLPRPASPTAQRGERTFLQMTCANCHAIKGTPAKGLAGPDLTHLAERQTLAAGVMENNPTNLARWLADPQAYKNDSLMPNLHLTPSQVDDLVNYLEGGRTGNAGGQGETR